MLRSRNCSWEAILLLILLSSLPNTATAIPPLQWPLDGSIQDEISIGNFGVVWTYGQCPPGTYKLHTGLDVQANSGDEVRAADDGIVKAVVLDGGWAQCVTIEHSGFTTVCWHLDALVGVGDPVVRGQLIGTIANLGGGTHFHFGVRDALYSDNEDTANRGALPTTDCGGDPAFPENFLNPALLVYDDGVDISCSYSVYADGSGPFSLAGWKFWRGVSGFYEVTGNVYNLPTGWHYSVWLVSPTSVFYGPTVNNSGSSSFSFGFDVPPGAPGGGGYSFYVSPQGDSGNPWCQSESFYLGDLPDLEVSTSPNPMIIEETSTVTWSVTGGIPGLPDGGWTGDIRLQWYQFGTGLANLVQIPVADGSYSFTTPASVPGGSVPGCSFQIAGVNAEAGTSIPGGYVSDLSPEFCIEGSPLCEVTPNNLNFNVGTIGQSQSQQFTIKNVGCGTLSGSVSESCSEFTRTPSSYSLGPNQTQTFTVTYTPTDCGNDNCTINTGSPCSSDGDVSCSATGPNQALCEVTPNNLNFNVGTIGQSQSQQFTIKNVGCGTLSGSVSESCSEFTRTPSSYSLGPNQTQTFTVTYTPTDCGNDNCTINTGSPCSSDGDVSCSATGPNTPICEIDVASLEFYVEDPHSSETDTEYFTVTNDGCGQLIVDEITVTNPDDQAELYSFSFQPPTLNLLENESQPVQVIWDPFSYGDATSYEFHIGDDCTPLIVEADVATPVLVSSFDMIASVGGVDIQWETFGLGESLVFRLTGWKDTEEWLVPFEMYEHTDSYAAFDGSESVRKGGLISYRLELRDSGSSWLLLREGSLEVEAVPLKTTLLGAFPNPFNPHVTIKFSLAEPGMMSMRVVDIVGREITTVVEDQFQPGEYSVIWRGKDSSGVDVPSGIYFAVYSTQGNTDSIKLVLLR